MRTAPESRKITAILKSIGDKSLQPQPDFQRRAVWTNQDKIAFIQTILSGYPFPEIYVASEQVNTETGEAVELLVDGQQRVKTIDEYFRGVSPFSRTQKIANYKNLEDEKKRTFLNYDVSVRNLGIMELKDIREIFKKINATSYDLNEMERYNAVYLGEYKKFCEEMAGNDFFREHCIFGPADIRRMRDVSFLCSLTSTMMSDYFNLDEQIEEYLQHYNEKFKEAEALEKRYENVFNLMNAMKFDKLSRAWKKVDFYTLFVELDRAANRQNIDLDANAVGRKLTQFFNSVNAVNDDEAVPEGKAGEYYLAAVKATNNRGARVARGRIIREMIAK